MGTNIAIDDELMGRAMRAAGTTTNRQTVALGLESLIRDRAKAGLKDLRGIDNWDGDLDEMRTDLDERSW